jgi:hypothetical protein
MPQGHATAIVDRIGQFTTKRHRAGLAGGRKHNRQEA